MKDNGRCEGVNATAGRAGRPPFLSTAPKSGRRCDVDGGAAAAAPPKPFLAAGGAAGAGTNDSLSSASARSDGMTIAATHAGGRVAGSDATASSAADATRARIASVTPTSYPVFEGLLPRAICSSVKFPPNVASSAVIAASVPRSPSAPPCAASDRASKSNEFSGPAPVEVTDDSSTPTARRTEMDVSPARLAAAATHTSHARFRDAQYTAIVMLPSFSGPDASSAFNSDTTPDGFLSTLSTRAASAWSVGGIRKVNARSSRACCCAPSRCSCL